MEKMKDVEKGSGVDELGCFVATFEGYKARPIEKVVSFVRARIEFSILAWPYVSRLVELKLVLKMKSRDDDTGSRSCS